MTKNQGFCHFERKRVIRFCSFRIFRQISSISTTFLLTPSAGKIIPSFQRPFQVKFLTKIQFFQWEVVKPLQGFLRFSAQSQRNKMEENCMKRIFLENSQIFFISNFIFYQKSKNFNGRWHNRSTDFLDFPHKVRGPKWKKIA